jgi:hypothetical protein
MSNNSGSLAGRFAVQFCRCKLTTGGLREASFAQKGGSKLPHSKGFASSQ